jgi:hypothetical protein
LLGLTAKSAIRPDANAGPMERHFNPLNVEDFKVSDLVSCFDVSFFVFAFCAEVSKPEMSIATTNKVAIKQLNKSDVVFLI